MTRVWIWKNLNIRSYGNFPHPKFREDSYAQKHKILLTHDQVRIRHLITSHDWLKVWCFKGVKHLGFPGGPVVKNPSANAGATGMGSLGWEDLLEEEMVTHTSILVWKILWTEKTASYSLWDCKELDMNEQTHTHMHTHTRARTHTCTHTHAHTHAHTHTHTHTHFCPPVS